MGTFNPLVSNQMDVIAAENLVRIVNDCTNILRKTKNPDTYISRYDFLIQVLQELSIYENRRTVQLSFSPSQVWVEMQNSFNQNIKELMDRCYFDCLHKISAMKTKGGKKGRIDALYDSFTAHMDRLTQENIEYYVYLCNQLSEKI